MNTKTMRLPPRRVLTPSASGSGTPSNKRKDREDPFERPKPVFATTTTTTAKLLKPDKPRPALEPSPTSSSCKALEPSPSNQILAGYLAHEYLTRGTLFGQPLVPPRTEGSTALPVVSDKRKGRLTDGEEEEEEGEAPPPCRREEEEEKKKKRDRYVEVAGLLKRGGGTYLPGVVNPTQLARILHL